jgi:hypothetical protein
MTLLFGVIGVYVALLGLPSIGLYHDDGVYVVSAKSLADGTGYRIVSLPDEPRMTKYPPLFPFLLSLVWRVWPSFPANAVALKSIAFLAGLGWLYALWKMFRTPWPILAFAVLPFTAFLFTTALAETLLGFLIVMSLLFLKEDKGWNPVVAAVFATLAFHAKTIGISMVVAGLIYLGISRKWRAFASFGLVCAAGSLPWVLWQAKHLQEAPGYYSSAAYVAGWNPLAHASWIGDVLPLNALFALTAPAVIAGVSAAWAQLVIGPAILLAGFVGFIRSVRTRISATEVFICVYLAIVAIWPWPPARFLVVVMPFVIHYASAATRSVAVVGLAVIGSLGLAGYARESLSLQASGYCDTRWQDFLQACSRIQVATPSTAVLAGNLDPTYYLFTGRKCLRPFEVNPHRLRYERNPDPLGDEFELEERLKGATYVVDAPAGGFEEGGHFSELLGRLEKQGKVETIETLAPGYRLMQVR